MKEEESDSLQPKGAQEKETEVIDGFTIKYHADGKSIWSKGKIVDGEPDGYWEWYRLDGTVKRTGYFKNGEVVGEWVTYDSQGRKVKTTNQDKGKK